MKVIETVYKGYRFRSRLEARWAVFFDALGLPWEYEPEGYDTGAGWYLPDFKVRYPGRWADEAHYNWFEVKGDLDNITEDEWRKMLAFEEAEGLVILNGTPGMVMYNPPSELKGKTHTAGCYGYALWSGKKRMWWDNVDDFYKYHGDETIGEIRNAVYAARQARFGK